MLAGGRKIGDTLDSSPDCPPHSPVAWSSPSDGRAYRPAAEGKRRMASNMWEAEGYRGHDIAYIIDVQLNMISIAVQNSDFCLGPGEGGFLLKFLRVTYSQLVLLFAPSRSSRFRVFLKKAIAHLSCEIENFVDIIFIGCFRHFHRACSGGGDLVKYTHVLLPWVVVPRGLRSRGHIFLSSLLLSSLTLM